jgi:hypothetical protein
VGESCFAVIKDASNSAIRGQNATHRKGATLVPNTPVG